MRRQIDKNSITGIAMRKTNGPTRYCCGAPSIEGGIWRFTACGFIKAAGCRNAPSTHATVLYDYRKQMSTSGREQFTATFVLEPRPGASTIREINGGLH
ncbi:hypothetical protein Zmor_019268 [Zophobas morio]|uniref:Uncharacterized protein n=1 Tax=Zophobas morio TaxID=2755281 RepID=A0AA38I1A9_9CUCU|nr:hypothetical protein Zmor_019268 [Zophobas morio]